MKTSIALITVGFILLLNTVIVLIIAVNRHIMLEKAQNDLIQRREESFIKWANSICADGVLETSYDYGVRMYARCAGND